MNSGFVAGRLSHSRFLPAYRNFEFDHFMTLINLEETNGNRLPWFLKSDKMGIFSIYSKNYINENNVPISDKLTGFYCHTLLPDEELTWMLLTTPRCLFYSFNPASFYFGLDQHGELKLAAVEVHNTFAESHVYALESVPGDKSDSISGTKSKEFHVSPFIEDYGQYSFNLHITDARIYIRIVLFQEQNKVMDVNFRSKVYPLNNSNFFRYFFKLMGSAFLTEIRILREAYVLFFRRKWKFIKKPVLRPNSTKSPSKGIISRLKLPF